MDPWENSFPTVAAVGCYQNNSNIEDMGTLLGHASIATKATMARKLARMEGEADHGWDGVAVALGVE